MPTYHYRCTECGHSFDQFQKFSEDSLTECPECHGLIKRVLHPVGIVFKGSGWYINDSRDASKSETSRSSSSSSKDANGASKTDSSSSAKSETGSSADKKPAVASTSSES